MMDATDKMLSKLIDLSLERPDLVPQKILVVNLSKATLEKILTPSRLDVIRTIREKNPKSVGELSRLSKRPLESISRDLRILENYGILEMIQTGRIKKPIIEKDLMLIPLKK